MHFSLDAARIILTGCMHGSLLFSKAMLCIPVYICLCYLKLCLHSSLTDVPFISGSEMIDSFTKLLEEADDYDNIHDIVLQVNFKYNQTYGILVSLTLNTLWENSADDKLTIFFLGFEMSILFSWKKRKKSVSKYCLLKF